ncbi:MAG TPA: universal stress protein [Mycobacteriales bacterium]|nr:universal stress protein [Mycobacteriales bacterium]
MQPLSASDLEPPHIDGPRRLLVGYDRHPASHRALVVAAALATALDATLVILHVVDLEDYPVDPDSEEWETAAKRTIDQERQEAAQLLASSRVQWAFETARDEPVHALARAAHDHDALFIVVGASGRGLAQRLLHGSVPQALLRKQRKPVLVVPSPAD